MTLTIDDAFLRTTLRELVSIDSRNPTLTPGAPGEAAIGRYVAGTLEQLGLETVTHPLAERRVNVVGTLRGSGGGRSLMLNGHLDTVGVDGMAAPFSAALDGGRLYGRGAQDMKASLAAMLAAAKALLDGGHRPAGDLVLAFVADEEAGSIGTEHLVAHYRTDAAVVTEPTDLALCRAHRGFIWFEVDTFGRAAHGSRYREGVDANLRMGRVLAELDGLERELRRRPPHPLAGAPSLHAPLVKGGSEASVYAAHCRLTIERRTVPGETLADATAELQAILDRLAADDPTFRAELKATFERFPFVVDENAAVVRAVERAARTRLGAAPDHVGATFWTDAALLADAGIDTVLIGPVGEGLHSAEEWVDLASAVDLAHILATTALTFCNGEQ